MKGLGRKLAIALAIGAALLLIATFLLLPEEAPKYSLGNRWTWQVTKQE